ncbi:O-methyltransferase [Mycobacterium sp. HNNTM2301]|uniref:O-methyltransferase n=1 Tax=Mycobacterium hainanense TaxID=3289775 RepID=UPI0035A6D372
MSMLQLAVKKPRKAIRLASSIPVYGLTSFRFAADAIHKRNAVQDTWELMRLVAVARGLRPEAVVEIGSLFGGTLYCWSQVAAPNATLIGIDLPGGDFGGGPSEEQAEGFRTMLREGQQFDFLPQDSHQPATVEAVRSLLGGKPIDFLFIDGDHTYEGVSQDFAMYSPLVRPGGVVAFHDIVPHTDPIYGVARFWNELKRDYQHEEFVYSWSQVGLGIGVIRMPS